MRKNQLYKGGWERAKEQQYKGAKAAKGPFMYEQKESQKS